MNVTSYNRFILAILIAVSISACNNPFVADLKYERFNLNAFESVNDSDSTSGVWVGVADHSVSGNWWTITGSKRYIIQISQNGGEFFTVDCKGVKSQVQDSGEGTIDIIGRRLFLSENKRMYGKVEYTDPGEVDVINESWDWIKISNDQLEYGLVDAAISKGELSESTFEIEAYCERSLLYSDDDGEKELKDGFNVAWIEPAGKGGYLQFWDGVFESQDHEVIESGRSYYEELLVPSLDVDVTSKKDSIESSFDGSLMTGSTISFKGSEINTSIGLYSYDIELVLNSWSIGE